MGFVSRKRGRLFPVIGGKRADGITEFYFFLFQLLLVVLVVFALLQYTEGVATDRGFEKRVTSIDLALFMTTVYHVSGTLKGVYSPPGEFDFPIEASISDDGVSINEPGTELPPVMYWFLYDPSTDILRGAASLKGIEAGESPVPGSSSGLVAPNLTFYRTGRGLSLSERRINALHLVCPGFNTTVEDWQSRKVFVAKVLPGSADYSNPALPVNRIAQILSSRYRQFQSASGAVSAGVSSPGTAITAIPADADIVLVLGDAGEEREPGSLIAYVPVDSALMRSRKFACNLINSLLSADSTVFYSQVMPVYTDTLDASSPLRVFAERSNPEQVMVFLDLSGFSEEQVDVDNVAIAVHDAIQRYYGAYDEMGVSGPTLSFTTASPVEDTAGSGEVADAGSAEPSSAPDSVEEGVV